MSGNNDNELEAIKADIESAESTLAILETIALACWFDTETDNKKTKHIRERANPPYPSYLIPTEADLEALLDTHTTAVNKANTWLHNPSPEAKTSLKSANERLQVLMREAPPMKSMFTVESKGGKKYNLANFVKASWKLEVRKEGFSMNNHYELPDGSIQREQWIFQVNIETVHKAWKAMPTATRPPHPITPLIKAWQLEQPKPVPYNNRTDRIFPSRLGMTNKQDKTSLKLFSPAAHAIQYGQQYLVGFEQAVHIPALPLALYDLGVGIDAPGPGAPLALRIWIQAILSVPLCDRTGNRAVLITPTMREFLKALYPTRLPKPNEYLPQLIRAADALASWKGRIPYIDPKSGRGKLRSVVTIAEVPTGKHLLDETIEIRVDLPTGAIAGPVIPESLPLWGVKSGAAYRALIGLAFLWHKPGKIHYPVRKGQHWLRSNDPSNYPQLSDAQLISLCYPIATIKQPRVLLFKAREVMRKLEAEGDLWISPDRRYCPPCCKQDTAETSRLPSTKRKP